MPQKTICATTGVTIRSRHCKGRQARSSPGAQPVRAPEEPAPRRLQLRTHLLGWESRLYIGQQEEVVQTRVCRANEVFTTGDNWKAGLLEKGSKFSADQLDQT